MKEFRKAIRKWLPALLSWWLILFPEIVFCCDMCTVCGEGKDIAAHVPMDSEALKEFLFHAEPEQIEYKSFLWELLTGGADDTKDG